MSGLVLKAAILAADGFDHITDLFLVDGALRLWYGSSYQVHDFRDETGSNPLSTFPGEGHLVPFYLQR